ncbi:Flp family type IVb pilin [Bosea sp. (in: a-proteobacteria)]|uniref:Flp family type IVb pilin n=1 Tax=Bosea sp. (in: a-proteobacteria) TaxID=1871050 RepID=UPI002DDD919D|nr:Flp family type IVb pilin [Bosea sp. (in: a-proteobacteria)]HEV2512731.1 Flp family type IVb pilin [Bosea sp. (in: a-proteobacteria)]
MKSLSARFAKDDSGATAMEYGLIAALISIVCVATWARIGPAIDVWFQEVLRRIV